MGVREVAGGEGGCSASEGEDEMSDEFSRGDGISSER